MEKLPQTSQAPRRRRSPPAGGVGGEQEGGRGPGKDAELTGEAAGPRFHSPSLLRPAPSCQPGSGAHRKALPFPVCFLGSFRRPPSLPKGVIRMTRQSLCPRVRRAGVLAGPRPERERMASSSPPSACSASLRRPSPPGPACAPEISASADPCRPAPTSGEPSRPDKARRGWVPRRSLGRFRERRATEPREREWRRYRGGKEQNSLRHGRWGRRRCRVRAADQERLPGGRAGVGLARRRLVPLVPPPPELRLPRKLIAT